jgi:hypothetical protein
MLYVARNYILLLFDKLPSMMFWMSSVDILMKTKPGASILFQNDRFCFKSEVYEQTDGGTTSLQLALVIIILS